MLRSVNEALERPLDAMPRDLDTAAALAEIEAELEPAGEKEAARAIDVVAETLAVPTPSAQGLAIYVRLLGKLPRPVLWKATERVLEAHTFKTLPTPGEWVKAAEDLMAEIRLARMRLMTYERRRQVAAMYYPDSDRPARMQEGR